MSAVVFSIIIPCYNQGYFLRACLDSLLRQDFKSWQAVIVNDGSTDDTFAIATSYAGADSRFIKIDQSNGGLSAARNTGIRAACGERFIFLDADDYLSDNCLQVLNDFLKNSIPDELLMYGYTYVTENGKKKLHSHLPGKEYELIPAVFSAVPAPCHAICISKELLTKCGFFDETLKSLEDWDMWIRAAKAGGKLKCIQQSLVFYRYVNNSMSRNAPVMYDALKKVALRAPLKDERLVNTLPGNRDYAFDVQPVLLNSLIKTLGVYLMQGHVEKALTLFQKESTVDIRSLPLENFDAMCSSLSFRYWNSKAEVKKVIKDIVPHFLDFFQRAGMSQDKTGQIMFVIFKRHLFYQNIFEWGPWAGRWKNYFLRRKKKYNANL